MRTLKFREAWRKIRQGIFPPANDENPVQYAFEFREGFNSLMDFDWVDYRGGVFSTGRRSVI